MLWIIAIYFSNDLLSVKFNIIADKTANTKEILQKMVDTLRKGGIKNQDDPSVPMFTVDVRGFQFKNKEGKKNI